MTLSSIPKKCPRCDGFMIREEDIHGLYGGCIACGYVYEPNVISPEELKEEEARYAGKTHRQPRSLGMIL